MKTIIITTTVAGLTLASALTGCVGHVGGTAHDHASSPRPLVTPRQAQEILAHYTAVNNRANATQNAQLLSTIETGSLFQQDVASYQQFSTLSAADQQQYRAPISYAPSQFYIPATGNWFMTYSTMSGLGVKKGSHQLCVFKKDGDASWKMAAAVYLDPGIQPPRISIDKAGFASAVESDSKIGPVALNSLERPVNDIYETGGNGAARQLADTPVKKSMLADYRSRNDWITYKNIFQTSYQDTTRTNDKNLPTYRDVYALKTTDGGVLALFTSYLDRNDYTVMPWQFDVIPGNRQNIYIKRKKGEHLMAIRANWSTQNAMHLTPDGRMAQLGAETELVGAKGIDEASLANPVQ